jgi:hypothetical protein
VCNPFAPHSCRNPGSFFPYLQDYKQKYPDVIVLDPPEAIQHLRNRQSMLQDVTQLDLCDCGGYVGVPKQLVITGDAASIPSSVAAAGLKLPLGLYQLYTSHCLYERCQ